MAGCPWTSGTASGRTSRSNDTGSRRRRSAERSGVVRTTSPRKLVCATSSDDARVSVDALCLIDHHDRYVVANGIHELAAPAGQAVLQRREHQIALAFRARKDVEHLFLDRHGPVLQVL